MLTICKLQHKYFSHNECMDQAADACISCLIYVLTEQKTFAVHYGNYHIVGKLL